ncbi:hypothetical protein EOPP23_14280 [Endozoicomonas sp. OPT23]|nr:hypothetical protein [Endozoicomonas sp. OPT23]
MPYKYIHDEAKQSYFVQGGNLVLLFGAAAVGYFVSGQSVNPNNHGLGKFTLLALFSSIFTFRQLQTEAVTKGLSPYEVSYVPDTKCPLENWEKMSADEAFIHGWNPAEFENSCPADACDVLRQANARPVITPLLTAGATGTINFGLNMLLELGFTHQSSTPSSGLSLAGTGAIGYKSIALTSGVEAQLNRAANNALRNHGLKDEQAQALASFSTFAVYSGIVSLGSYLGAMEKGSLKSSVGKAERLKGFGYDLLPQAMVISAAYSLQSAVENTCVASFDSFYPDAENFNHDAKVRICKFSTSTVLALLVDKGLIRFSKDSFKSLFLQNYAEASSLVFTEALISYGRSRFDDPLYGDLAGLSLGAGYTGVLVKLDQTFNTLLTTNAVHGAGLLMLLEASNAILSHGYALRPVSLGGYERRDTEDGAFYCLPENTSF